MPAAAYQEMVDYVTKAAIARGIDPAVAVRVAQTEALNVFDPSKPDMGGDDHSSFGLYQLHYGGLSKAMPNPGLGDEFTRVTGLDARDPSTWRQQVDFSLDHAAKHGWGSWMGAKNNGIGDYEGISGASRRVSGPVEAAGGGAGADVGAPVLYSPPDVASVFANLNTTGDDPLPAAPYEARRSTLGDDLAASVSATGNRRQSSEGGNAAVYGEEPDSSQPLDFGGGPQPSPSDAGQAPSALASSSPDQSLADLFKVKDIGQAALTDPRTGASLIRRQRRAYG
jgi:hypothetical protein